MAKRKFTVQEVLEEIAADTDSAVDPFSSEDDEVSVYWPTICDKIS